MQQALKQFYPVKRIRSKLNLPGFYEQWQLAKADPEYVRLAAHHRDQYEGVEPVAAKSPGFRQ